MSLDRHDPMSVSVKELVMVVGQMSQGRTRFQKTTIVRGPAIQLDARGVESFSPFRVNPAKAEAYVPPADKGD